MRINATLVSVQSSRAAYNYGQIARTPFQTGTKRALLRANIPVDVPEDAVVTKAELVFRNHETLTGSRQLTAQRNAAGWTVSTVTWNNSPGVTGTATSVTIGSGEGGRNHRIDVSADVQAMIAGTVSNYGWRITTDDASRLLLRGSKADSGQPYLDLEYAVLEDEPSGLSPDGGAVSVQWPTLTFNTGADEMTALQVQIDPAADPATAWDSGEVAATAGLFPLAGTTYLGLADGATTSWRARVKTALGWSDYSDWATFSHVAKPTVAVTSPGATTGDPTPPITWTSTGQTAWKATLLDAGGKVLAESRETPGAAAEWTPPKGLKREGDIGTAVVRVWDDVDRVATPGDPVYSEDTQVFTLVADSLEPAVENLTAAVENGSPVVRVSWRSTPASDEYQIIRDGKWIERVDGSLNFYRDWYATPKTLHRYSVRRVSNGKVSPHGTTVSLAPRPAGAWLMDPDSEAAIQVLDVQHTGDMIEQSVMHNVLDGAPIRRRAGMPPPKGAVSGLMVSQEQDASAMFAAAMAMKANDAGTVYRLVYGDWNIPVTIGDLDARPNPDDDYGRSYTISFSWWQTDDELPWDD